MHCNRASQEINCIFCFAPMYVHNPPPLTLSFSLLLFSSHELLWCWFFNARTSYCYINGGLINQRPKAPNRKGPGNVRISDMDDSKLAMLFKTELIGPEAQSLQRWEAVEGLGWDAPHQSPPWQSYKHHRLSPSTEVEEEEEEDEEPEIESF